MTFDAKAYYRRSLRLSGYDYSQEGAYFVTICTRDRAPLFDNEANRQIAEQCWLSIPDHFPMVQLDEWVVMPNHVHGILTLVDDGRGTACRAPTPAPERFGQPTPSSLPTIVRSFKSAVTKRVNLLQRTPGAPVWQRNYFEHVI